MQTGPAVWVGGIVRGWFAFITTHNPSPLSQPTPKNPSGNPNTSTTFSFSLLLKCAFQQIDKQVERSGSGNVNSLQ